MAAPTTITRPRNDEARHAHGIGANGVGKSTLLASLIRREIGAGRGVILVDPHGDLFEEVRRDLPAAAATRAVIADGSNTVNPCGLNILELQGGDPAIERNLNQSLGQLDGLRSHSNVAHAVLAIVGTIVSFLVGADDAERLARWFESEIGKADLSRLSDFEAATRLLVGGSPQPAFRFHMLPPGPRRYGVSSISYDIVR